VIDNNPYKMMLPDVASLENIIKTPEIEASTQRIRIFGLLNHQKSQSTTPVMIVGINSTKELSVCPRLAQAIQMGQMLDSTKEVGSQEAAEEELVEAPPIKANTKVKTAPKARGTHQILVTPGLLRGLGAQIGDEVVVLLQDKSNMQQALVANITGVVDFAMPTTGGKMAWMDFSTLQEVSGLKNEATEFALRVKEGTDVNSVKAKLISLVDSGLVVETWEELGGLFRDAMALQNMIFSAILVIVFSIVISAIVNTSLMTVMERTREIGTLMALGYRRRQLMMLFLIEFATIGFVGGVSGLTAAGTLLWIFGKKGITITLPGQAASTILYPYTTVSFLSLVLILSLIAALLAGIVPAYRASRMRPVDALRSN
jgi:ABC-type lipoprotein release transport system permease subunit